MHVAKSKLGLDDDTYRDVLKAHAGVTSSKAISYEGFKSVMTYFEGCGFKPSGARRRARGAGPNAARQPGMATVKQLKKIYAMWFALSGSWYKKGKEYKALRGFLKKRFRVDHENFLTFEKASDVIEALKKIGTR